MFKIIKVSSIIYKEVAPEASTLTPVGKFNAADVADPPSPM